MVERGSPGGWRAATFRLQSTLLRQLDEAIAADGAYADRSEYVADALWDKLARDGISRARATARAPVEPRAEARVDAMSALVHENAAPLVGAAPMTATGSAHDVPALGAWSSEDVPTAAAEPQRGTSFGLHNRDLPSLYALNLLCQLAVERRGPTPWDVFIGALRAGVAELGPALHALDRSGSSALRASVGFPKPDAAGDKSFDRFVAAYVGNGRSGPILMLALATSVREDDRALLPTEEGVGLLRSLVRSGLSGALPHPADALAAWWQHLSGYCPDEHAAWRRLLGAAARRPGRPALVASFPEWTGSKADTNVMGFVSRSREWGLLEPDLVDGRYQVTQLGARAREDLHG